jgi:hypothetical protein
MIHVIVLILSIAGQPERIAAVLNDEHLSGMSACNKLGTDAQAAYAEMFNKLPSDVSYRCVPAVVRKVIYD